MKANIKNLEKNTKLLERLINSVDSLVDKWDIVEQLESNLKELKENLDSKTFEDQFGKIDVRITKIMNKLSDPEFVKTTIAKLEKVFNKI